MYRYHLQRSFAVYFGKYIYISLLRSSTIPHNVISALNQNYLSLAHSQAIGDEGKTSVFCAPYGTYNDYQINCVEGCYYPIEGEGTEQSYSCLFSLEIFVSSL